MGSEDSSRRTPRALVTSTPPGFACILEVILESKIAQPQLTAAPRGPLADALYASEQPPGCPRDRPRGGSHT